MIEVKNITKIFKKPVRKQGIGGMIKTLFSNKYDSIVAVNNISFTIHTGEIVGYIGSNGAGKSTTIKMMCGILTPTSGQILIDGMEPYNSKTRNKVTKNIGVVFGQRSQLWWDLPLIETFRLLKLIYEVPDTEWNERFEYFKEVLDIGKFLNSPARTLSLGQRMRADLAASLLHNPKVLFLDEPTIGLDVLVKEKILTAIKDINKKFNTTVIVTTHDMNDITELCKRIIIIDEGNILYDGPLKNIKNRFGDIRHIYISSSERMNLATFNAAFEHKLSFEKDENFLIISFDAAILSINDIVNYIFQNCKVKDFKITENNIESVVKKIYEEKSI
ncbi:MAG: ATP-binding cassette domain-containing protein [Bacilli bacterium]|jgi:ABC-2 type transport system ATP-binding protein|nr:ATP-binding cassette domain-containing protein [Bacilli bacterium]MDD4057213.1 ATP-binding cassette domain-containing protein [Bacilli bacterium]MDY0209209.1 ATP-binding cassette domain-containing protein [Bacilli bacterium]